MSTRLRLTSPRVVVQLVLVLVVLPFLPLWISRRWGWWEAWAFGPIGVLGFATSGTLVKRRLQSVSAPLTRRAPWGGGGGWMGGTISGG